MGLASKVCFPTQPSLDPPNFFPPPAQQLTALAPCAPLLEASWSELSEKKCRPGLRPNTLTRTQPHSQAATRAYILRVPPPVARQPGPPEMGLRRSQLVLHRFYCGTYSRYDQNSLVRPSNLNLITLTWNSIPEWVRVSSHAAQERPGRRCEMWHLAHAASASRRSVNACASPPVRPEACMQR